MLIAPARPTARLPAARAGWRKVAVCSRNLQPLRAPHVPGQRAAATSQLALTCAPAPHRLFFIKLLQPPPPGQIQFDPSKLALGGGHHRWAGGGGARAWALGAGSSSGETGCAITRATHAALPQRCGGACVTGARDELTFFRKWPLESRGQQVLRAQGPLECGVAPPLGQGVRQGRAGRLWCQKLKSVKVISHARFCLRWRGCW